MGDDDVMRAQLLQRIATRRAEIVRYVGRMRPWSNRLGTVSAVSSGLVAVTTAGPALGGDGFLSALAGGGETLGLWQGACLIALVVSVVSTLSASLLRKQDVAGRVATAESASAELGNLATALEFSRLDLGEAVTRFQQATSTVPFVDERGAGNDAPAPVPAAPMAPGPMSPPAPAPFAMPLAGPPPGSPRPGVPAPRQAVPHSGPVPRPVPAYGPPPGRAPYRG